MLFTVVIVDDTHHDMGVFVDMTNQQARDMAVICLTNLQRCVHVECYQSDIEQWVAFLNESGEVVFQGN